MCVRGKDVSVRGKDVSVCVGLIPGMTTLVVSLSEKLY